MKDTVEFEKLDLTEKTLDSHNVYDGKLLHVYRDKVMLPGGRQGSREYIKHPGAVAVVAVDNNNRIAVEHQFRYPFGTELLEIPAGKLENRFENPLEAAKRELREETGIVAGTYRYLGPLYPTVAYSDEVIHLFWAKDLSYGERHLDTDESINVEMIDLDKFVKMILDGKVPDSKTQTAVLKVHALMLDSQRG